MGEVGKLEMTMKVLIQLQNCDSQIRDFQSKKAAAPVKIQRLEEGLKLAENKKERRQAEQDIEDFENQINKSNIKLANIKSNKEYKAVLKEIDDLNTGKGNLEDKALRVMEDIEALEERCDVNKASKKELEEKFEKDRDEILKILEAIDKDLKNLEKKRERFCQIIDEDLLRRYDSLREHRGGLAINPVIQGVCQGCHMGIPPQKFNELVRGEELMSCPHCMRIIYWSEDKRFQDVGI
jgi:predicted  nucleic acid-binding Zn-ribbon protein